MSKDKFTLEYDMKRTPIMLLWGYIASASGLSQWFADSVEHIGKKFTFKWSGTESDALQISIRMGYFIRLRWNDDVDDNHFFEFKISVSEITDSTILSITDFSDSDELDESMNLWNSQIYVLKRCIGCL
ncbi:MAG: START-like domain-containing protein [Muribaculaceae bacterium]